MKRCENEQGLDWLEMTGVDYLTYFRRLWQLLSTFFFHPKETRKQSPNLEELLYGNIISSRYANMSTDL